MGLARNASVSKVGAPAVPAPERFRESCHSEERRNEESAFCLICEKHVPLRASRRAPVIPTEVAARFCFASHICGRPRRSGGIRPPALRGAHISPKPARKMVRRAPPIFAARPGNLRIRSLLLDLPDSVDARVVAAWGEIVLSLHFIQYQQRSDSCPSTSSGERPNPAGFIEAVWFWSSGR